MPFTQGPFETGRKVAITDGRTQITFDTPGDFADWMAEYGGPLDWNLWQWVKP